MIRALETLHALGALDADARLARPLGTQARPAAPRRAALRCARLLLCVAALCALHSTLGAVVALTLPGCTPPPRVASDGGPAAGPAAGLPACTQLTWLAPPPLPPHTLTNPPQMADLPLDPPLARMLLAASQMGCTEEVLTVVAMLRWASRRLVPGVLGDAHAWGCTRARRQSCEGRRGKCSVQQGTLACSLCQCLRPCRPPCRSVQSIWAPGGRREVDDAKARWVGGSVRARGPAVLRCGSGQMPGHVMRAPWLPWQRGSAVAEGGQIDVRPPTLSQCARRFAVAEGDLVSYLNVWRAWEEAGRSKQWAVRSRVMHRNLLRAADIRAQLQAHLRRLGLRQGSALAGASSFDAEPLTVGACCAMGRAGRRTAGAGGCWGAVRDAAGAGPAAAAARTACA